MTGRALDEFAAADYIREFNSVPAGLEDVSKMPALTEALLRRGYSESDVRKILGGNLLRVLEEVTGR